jgi:hypothetical protein
MSTNVDTTLIDAAVMPTSRPVSRRRFLAGVALTAGTAILAACGGSSTTTDTPKAAGGPTSAAAATSAPAASGSAITSAATVPAAAGGKGKTLKMGRSLEPITPFVPWQINNNPASFISVNI